MTINFDEGSEPEIEVRHRLRIAREWAHLEQSELAERMGVARNTVSNYENGETTNMRKIVLNAWALACGVSLKWIMGEVRPTPPKPTRTQTTDESRVVTPLHRFSDKSAA